MVRAGGERSRGGERDRSRDERLRGGERPRGDRERGERERRGERRGDRSRASGERRRGGERLREPPLTGEREGVRRLGLGKRGGGVLVRGCDHSSWKCAVGGSHLSSLGLFSSRPSMAP
jgi:hypothetical protein